MSKSMILPCGFYLSSALHGITFSRMLQQPLQLCCQSRAVAGSEDTEQTHRGAAGVWYRGTALPSDLISYLVHQRLSPRCPPPL